MSQDGWYRDCEVAGPVEGEEEGERQVVVLEVRKVNRGIGHYESIKFGDIEWKRCRWIGLRVR